MKVYILNTLQSGIDLYNLLKDKIAISGYIGLSDTVNKNNISGYCSIPSDLKKNDDLEVITLESYAINNINDKNKLLNLKIDVLIVGGWQRLVPEWFIEHCKMVIGSHGSPLGINKGRGRSPQNWALINNFEKFEISIFKIDKGIDSGPVINSKWFTYNQADDIRTSYIKVTCLVAEMIMEYVRNPKSLMAQNDESAEYLPQRLEEDGAIDWNRDNNELYDFVRGLTKPYPGAFTVYKDLKIRIWRSVCFDYKNEGVPNGTILELFCNGELLINCKKGSLIITEYSIEGNESLLQKNIALDSVDYSTQLQKIVSRHNLKYPELKLSERILNIK